MNYGTTNSILESQVFVSPTLRIALHQSRQTELAFDNLKLQTALSAMSSSPQMSSLSCASIDDSFGPYANDCRGGFDFTQLFEETILFIVPVAILLVVAPFRVWYLLKKATKVVSSPLLHLKLVRDESRSVPRPRSRLLDWLG